MSAQVISEGEAETYLGDLLFRLDRASDAESHLTKAIQLDAKLSAAQAAMGRLQLKKGNRAEALAYAKKAAELDPDNYLAHYSYASMIRNQREAPPESDREIMRRELKRTIELAPQFVEATEMLASENLARNLDTVETIELLAKAMAIAPGRNYLALQLASALSRTQQREKARPLLQSLLASPGLEPPVRQNAQNLLAFLDRAAAAENANREFERNRAVAEQLLANSVETRAAVANTAPPEVRRDARTPVAPTGPVVVVRNTQPLAPGTARIRGMMTLLDCSDKGLTFSLRVDGKTVKLHSSTPNEIKFTSFNAAVSGSISCGPVPGNGVPASIVYKVQESEGSIGSPLTVDFVESLDTTSEIAGLPPIPGTATIKGMLTVVECSNGVTLTLTSEGKTVLLRSEAFSVAFLNGPNSDGTVDCTRLPGAGLPVTIVYRPSNTAGVLGEPVIVQFQRN